MAKFKKFFSLDQMDELRDWKINQLLDKEKFEAQQKLSRYHQAIEKSRSKLEKRFATKPR